jgi:hypothetical protein
MNHEQQFLPFFDKKIGKIRIRIKTPIPVFAIILILAVIAIWWLRR